MLVVGAGIIGRSTAYFLARQGAKVVLLDEGIPAGSPTSRASLGVLTHCNGGDNPYAQLFRDGHALHARLARDLAEDLGADVGWRPLGGIDLFADPSQLEEVWRFNRERGCRVERLDERALRDAEPGLDGGGEGLYFADDHRVDPLKLGTALWAAAVRQGASAAWGERVWRIAHEGEAVEVATSRETHRAGLCGVGGWGVDRWLGRATRCPRCTAPGAGPTSAFCRCPAAPPSEDKRTPLYSRRRRNDRGSDVGGGRLSVGDDSRGRGAICLGGAFCTGEVLAAVAPAGRFAAQAPRRASAHRPADGCARAFSWPLGTTRTASC